MAEKDLSGLKTRLTAVKKELQFDGERRKGAASDVPVIERVAHDWHQAEGKSIASSDRNAVTMAYSVYWAELFDPSKEKGK